MGAKPDMVAKAESSPAESSLAWRRNLEGDEQVVWSGVTSDKLRREEIIGKRLIASLVLMGSVGLGLNLIWNLTHPAPTEACHPPNCSIWPDFSILYVFPLQMLGAFTCGTVALFAAIELFYNVRPWRVYAVTSTRLLVCDGQGAIFDQLSVGNVAELRWKSGIGLAGPILEVRRKRDPEFRGALMVRNVVEVAGLEKALKGQISPP